ncbi:2-oxoglutarate-Fe(II) type Oxidoreductase [Sphaerulina musiva]
MKPHAVSTAVSEANLEIPLIDFSAFLTGDAATKKSTAQAILAGFQTAGFVYLSKHGVPEDVLEKTFAESAKFFKRPRGEKDALAWTTPEANRGYSQPGREKVTDAETPEEIEAVRTKEGSDLKESLEIGKEGEPGMPNPWPRQDAAGTRFREQMLQFFDECKILHINIMRAIAVGLNIEEKWFDRYCDAGDNTLRLLHYPEVPADVFRRRQEQEDDVVEQVRAGAHTDYGSITCLFQDMAGGLQVKSPTGKFVNATPIEGTVVVNAGDLLARWSNDVIKSTVHRVVEPPTKSTVHPARYTIPYFCHPNHDSIIDAIPGTFSAENPRKYSAVNCGEHLVKRLRATY